MVKTLKQFIDENKKHPDDHRDVINKLGDDIDKHTGMGNYLTHTRGGLSMERGPTDEKKLKAVIAKADSKHLHILKHFNNGVSGTREHPCIPFIDAELRKRKSTASDEQVEAWDDKHYSGHGY